jgi:uncharacterized membrane protein YdbT with pleckstrin-like domain
MLDPLRARLLRLLRVPSSPDTPAGSTGSAQVFHASRNFYRWSVIRWAVVQLALVLGLNAEIIFTRLMLSRNAAVPPWVRFSLINAAVPPWVRFSLIILEAISVVAFLAQFAVTYFALRIGFEMRWYIVTDRSLRIRSGVWSVEELTMTFANIQQITVNRGPLQGLLGIADVQVLSAGGGGGGKPGEKDSHGHAGRFQGVDNADSIRDLILERLRHYKDAGLGDTDDTPPVLTAAKEVLNETRRLRISMTSSE